MILAASFFCQSPPLPLAQPGASPPRSRARQWRQALRPSFAAGRQRPSARRRLRYRPVCYSRSQRHHHAPKNYSVIVTIARAKKITTTNRHSQKTGSHTVQVGARGRPFSLFPQGDARRLSDGTLWPSVRAMSPCCRVGRGWLPHRGGASPSRQTPTWRQSGVPSCRGPSCER